MRIDIITCLPGMFGGFLDESIMKRAREKNIMEIHVHNLRDYTNNRHRQVDDYAYGGGAGMVLMIEPIVNCLRKLQHERSYDEVIYLSPDGELFVQQTANELSMKKNLILLSGHYKGVDERVRTHFITREISIGDYVLSGGELPAAVVTDALVRLLPGALGDETSALSDSYQDGLVAPPAYTRPEIFEGIKVPDVLLSGHAANIEKWRFEKAVERTEQRRPDLLKGK
ncbi:MAG: tRNA (guanosine(37)-N1)-methyltransferase TrmD [Cyclobacteriaceae bacterium]|nr:tRNA (guanosine(37)-N1)-methyltransferase TrmD [Cyclobacteriaceae bacterium]